MLRRVLPLTFALGCTVAACKETGESATGEAAEAGTPPPPTETPPTPSSPPRIDIKPGRSLDLQPGYLQGGMFYAALRVAEVQSFLQKLPLPPDAVRDLAEVGSELGMDLRVEDVRKRFSIPDDAIVSATFGRPLATTASSVRADLARGGEFLDLVGGPQPPIDTPVAERTIVEKAKPLPKKKTESIVAPEPEEEEPPPKPEPSPAAKAEAEAFKRRASALGIHSRIHIPVSDPSVFPRELESRVPRRDRTRWDALCGRVTDARLCVGDSELVAVFRERPRAIEIDVIWWAMGGGELTPERLEAAVEAIGAGPATVATLSDLKGDAAGFLAMDAIPPVAEVAIISEALRSLQWSSPGDRADTVGRRLEKIDMIKRQLQAPLLFSGAQFEATASETRVQAELRWRVRPDQQTTATELMEGSTTPATVPTLAALCEGALMCARTRGVPKPSRLADALANGLYAEDQRAVERALNRGDEWTAFLFLAGTWPNLAGAASRWPAQEVGSGPEAALAKGVVDAVARVQGIGGSVRSLSVGGRGQIHADYAAYARVTSGELALMRSLLALGEIRLSETTVTGVEGKVQMVRLPVDEAPVSLMTYLDPEKVDIDGTPTQVGWAAAVDGPDRFSWLLGLEREQPKTPSAYFEIPDLWRLASVQPDVARELAFGQTWASARSLKMALTVDKGEPRIVAVLERSG